MKADLTKRGDYAIRAMIDLARSTEARPRSARRIAAEMAIPPRFLPQVMADLVRAGLVHAEPGRNGGHGLAHDAEAIDLLEIIEAVEGSSQRRSCVLSSGPCNPSGTCDVHEVFNQAHQALIRVLAEADLASVARPRARAGGGPLIGVAARSLQAD